jgi:FKBP-type peptidyl-prolyl isomerase-like protein
MFAALACWAAPAQQAPAPAPAAAAQTSAPAAPEPAMWESMQSSTDPTDYMNYLKRYPDGPHVGDAMKRVESYALGLNYGLNLHRQPIDVDVTSVLHGVQDQLTGAKLQMASQDVEAALADLQTRESANRDRQRILVGDKSSYALGVNYALVLAKDAIDADPPSLLRGLSDVLTGEKPLLTNDEAQAALVESSIRSSVKSDEMHGQVAEENGKRGADFLAANQKKEGVVTLRSGLQYKILKAGTPSRAISAEL